VPRHGGLPQSGARAVTDRASWLSPRAVYVASWSAYALELAPYLKSRVNRLANKLGGSVAPRRIAPIVVACATEISAIRPRRRFRASDFGPEVIGESGDSGRKDFRLVEDSVDQRDPDAAAAVDGRANAAFGGNRSRESRDRFKGTLAKFELFLKSF